MTRFEVELRKDIVRRYPYRIWLDDDFIFFRLVKSFYHMNTQYFKFLKDDDFKNYLKKYNKKLLMQKEKIIRGDADASPMTVAQARLATAQARLNAQERYGSDFVDAEDRKRTIVSFLAF